MLATIPEPPFQKLGPIHMYGIMLAIGVVVAWQISKKRWRDRGHDPDEIDSMALWVIIAGVLGARVYHLFTGYDWERNGIGGTLALWNGGLSIWGAVLGGGVAAVIIAWRRKIPALELLDTLALGVVVAQAIGRWGNYFNQELFGRPLRAPWALEVSPEVALRAGFPPGTTFHPTFLYESLWCIAVFLVLTWAEKHYGARWRVGWTFCGYVALYTLGRTYFEWLRIDKAQTVFGTSFNLVLSVVLCLAAVVGFVVLARVGRRYPGPPSVPAPAPAGGEPPAPDGAERA